VATTRDQDISLRARYTAIPNLSAARKVLSNVALIL
jgi:hypothetical protein